MNRFLAAWAGMVLLLCGCLQPAGRRADLDQQPVEGTAGTVRYEVEGGLAVVEGAAAGALHLFAQTPVLRVNLQVNAAAPQRFQLEVDNCMPAAALTAAPPLSVSEGATARPTLKSWALELPASGTVRLLVAPADHDAEQPFRFAVLSDVQDAVDRVDDIFTRMNNDGALRFVLSTGDLSETGERRELERFKQALGGLKVPLYSTIGNHDAMFDRGDSVWHEELGRHSFTFGFKGVTFSLLDSASYTVDPVVYDWLDHWLAAAKDRTHVVATHVPILDPAGLRNGSFRSRLEAGKLLSRLAQGQVDLTLYGHIHSYRAFSNAGIPAYISGGGGAIPEAWDGVGRHYLTVDLSAAQGVSQVALVRVDGG